MNSLNAVTRCMDYLQSQWGGYRKTRHSRVCRCLVKQNVLPLIDTFCQVQANQPGKTSDRFLRFDVPFFDPLQYGKALSGELSSPGNGFPPAGKNDPTSENQALGFLRDLFHYALNLDLSEDQLVVACLLPSTVEDRSGWSKWWNDALSLQLPPQIRILVCDTLEDEAFGTLAAKYPETLTTFRPEIDAVAIIRQLMDEYGDQNDPTTHFRKAFFELTQQVGRQDANGIRQTAKAALSLARQTGFPHLEITVLCTAGNGLAYAGQLDEGLKAFDEARRIAKASANLPLTPQMPELTAETIGTNIYDQLGTQALFFKAAALIGAGQFDRAFHTYQEAAAALKETLKNDDPKNPDAGLIFHLIEALRMSGYCLEQLNEKQQADSCYEESLQSGLLLDTATRKNTNLAFSGRALLDIYQTTGNKTGYLAASEKLDTLLGVGWEKTLSQKMTIS